MPEREKIVMKELATLSELAVDGLAVTLDPTEDAWEYAAPPPKDVYDIKVYLNKSPWKIGYKDANDPKSLFIRAALECKIVSTDTEIDGLSTWAYVSTEIYRGKNISTMAGLITKMGFKIPTSMTPKNTALLLEKAIKAEKLLKAEVDWKASYMYVDAKSGKELWENVYNHYEEFPDADGGGKKYLFSTTSKGGGVVEIRAQTYVNRFFAMNDTLPAKDKLVSAPRLTQVSKLETSEPELSVATESKPSGNAKVEETDLELMLA